MAAATLYYPSTVHRAVPNATTGFATNFPVYNALDFNVDSYAEASAATATINVDLDAQFGNLNTVDYSFVAVFVTNYLAMAGTPYATLHLYTDTDSGFASPTDHGAKTLNEASYMPLVVWELGATYSERYLKIDIDATGKSDTMRVSMVLWGHFVDLSSRHQWNGQESQRAFNAIDEMGGGRELVRNMRSHTPRAYSRTWEYLSDTQLGYIKTAHQNCRGRWLPFILRDEEEVDANAKLCKFADDQLVWTPVQNDFNNVTLNLIEIPYTTDQRQW